MHFKHGCGCSGRTDGEGSAVQGAWSQGRRGHDQGRQHGFGAKKNLRNPGLIGSQHTACGLKHHNPVSPRRITIY